eukprot:TRINITY_DN958_c0_g1_i3.p1 TRINITY_DN958_c0_g1~~TRINITY_DN958_c0_g1_i3.p1  ORF type:complete len:414 (-),score=78.84 TRINITY_DN958_c0_g1_i3:295-1500(-)
MTDEGLSMEGMNQEANFKRSRDEAKDLDDHMDRHGNPASKALFFDRLPPSYTEQQLQALLGAVKAEYESIRFGTKKLLPTEFRTCSVNFPDIEKAVATRKALQGYREDNWLEPLVINFVKVKKNYGYPQNPTAFPFNPLNPMGGISRPTMSLDYVPDRNGNPACDTLFIVNFHPNTSEEMVACLFPQAKTISLSKKALKEGQTRTCYIQFRDIETAVAMRQALTGYIGGEQKEPLVIHYSKQASATNYPYKQSPYMNMGMPLSPLSPLSLTSLSGMSPLATLPSLSTNPASMNESYFDVNGNPASIGLFIDKWPPNINEPYITSLFGKCPGFKAVRIGTKMLNPGEYRTCFVYFDSIENAVYARNLFQGYRELHWDRGILINFAQTEKIPVVYYSNGGRNI